MQKSKKFFNSIWSEFIYGGHLISLGGVGIVYASSILLNIEITWDFLIIVYLATYTFLLYNRYKELRTDFLTNPDRTKHLNKYIRYTPLIITCFIIILIGISLWFNKILALFFIFLVFILGLLYTVFIKEGTKRILALKNLIFSLLAALMILFLAIYYSYPFQLPLLLIFIFVFLRLFVNTVFLDIKDIKSDMEKKLLTLPIVLGKQNTLNLLYLISILAVFPIVFGFFLDLFPTFSLVILFTIPYTFYYLRKSKERNVDFVFLNYFLADAEFILWPIFILFGKFLLW